MHTSEHSHLLFRLDQLWFVVGIKAVREILNLPALSPAPEAPPYIAGILNLRGNALPVMDLRVRFGAESGPRNPDDVVIILDINDRQIGILASGIAGLRNFQTREFQAPPDYGSMHFPPPIFLSGVAPVPEGLAMLLHVNNLVQLPPNIANRFEAPAPLNSESTDDIFRQRALNYARTPKAEPSGDLLDLAVFSLNGEFYAIDLRMVREFTELSDPVPVPCCPPHVTGVINVRGNLLTVLNLRFVLNLPAPTAVTGTLSKKVIIIQSDTFIAGIAVHEVCDVIHIHPSEIVASPSPCGDEDGDYLVGTAVYHSRVLTILDPTKLLAREDLIVDQRA